MVQVKCPGCETVLTVAENGHAAFRCPSCGDQFSLTGPGAQRRQPAERRPAPRPAEPRKKPRKVRGLVSLVIIAPACLALMLLAPFFFEAAFVGLVVGFPLMLVAFFKTWSIMKQMGKGDDLDRVNRGRDGGAAIIMMTLVYAFRRPRTLGSWAALEVIGILLIIECCVVASLGEERERREKNQATQQPPARQVAEQTAPVQQAPVEQSPDENTPVQQPPVEQPPVQREPVRPAPAPVEQPAPRLAVETVLPGWGTAIDPDGDCTFTPNGKVLTFKVPGTPPDLSAERGRVNAPRVLQELEGDFSFLVKVCGPIRPGPVGTVQGSVSFQSGGLLVWTDQQNYIRLERSAMNRNGTVQMSVTMETRSNGRVQLNGTLDLPEQEVYLRMRRAGGQILGAVSRDGQQWRNVGTVNVPFPAKIQAGLSAVNAAQQPLAVRFEEFQVRKGAVTGS